MIFRAFTFGVASVIGIALGTWIVERDPPVVITKIDVDRAVVQPGDKLKLHLWVRRYKNCYTKIDRVLIYSDKVRVELMDSEFARPLGPLGDDDYRVEVYIPSDATNGPAVYRTVTTYRCNLIHDWFWPIIVGPNDVVFSIQGVPTEFR